MDSIKLGFPCKRDIIIERFEESCMVLIDESDDCYFMSELSARILELCNGSHKVDDIASIICNEYEVDYKQCLNDIIGCLTEMSLNKIIDF